MREANTAGAKVRGRPSTGVQRHVVQDLMRAAEAALGNKTASETTIREIAAAAGTNEAMINYYFGGKDGLIFALFSEVLSDHPNTRAEQISLTCIEQASIRPLVEQLTRFYYSRPNIIKMAISEMASASSNIKSIYIKKHAENTPRFIKFTLNAMTEAGIYKREIDVEFLAMSIMSMIIAPSFLSPATDVLHMSDQLQSAEWIDHIAKTVDLLARAPTH